MLAFADTDRVYRRLTLPVTVHPHSDLPSYTAHAAAGSSCQLPVLVFAETAEVRRRLTLSVTVHPRSPLPPHLLLMRHALPHLCHSHKPHPHQILVDLNHTSYDLFCLQPVMQQLVMHSQAARTGHAGCDSDLKGWLSRGVKADLGELLLLNHL